MSRQLTERQQKFLDVLFDGANGDVTQAKILAGYSETSSTTDIIKSLKEEIMDLAEESQQNIRGLRYTPASALGTCRFKLKKDEEYERALTAKLLSM